MSGENHGGIGLSDVPDPDGAVAGAGGKYVSMARVLDGGVNTVDVFLKGLDVGGTVEGPKLNGVILGRGEEGVTTDGVIVGRVDFAGMFVEGADVIVNEYQCAPLRERPRGTELTTVEKEGEGDDESKGSKEVFENRR
ncbi:hypothetical protein RJT34_16360 [Clitoria ternatea]|uniref:Uncharacterized protein n=1 Tax=Clitoria ternatea TaxID=43366 RepID=A0AAN9PDL1_CLITE